MPPRPSLNQVSSKTGDRVRDAFYLLACTIMNQRLESDPQNIISDSAAISMEGGGGKPRGGCSC